MHNNYISGFVTSNLYTKLFYMFIYLRDLYLVYDTAEPLRGYDQTLGYRSIMQEEKPNQAEHFKMPKERISKFFPPGTPAPKPESATPPETEPTTTPEPSYPTPFPVPDKESGSIPIMPIIVAALIAALLAGGGVYFFLRHNVKVCAAGDRGRVLVAKVRISASNPTIEFTPLAGHNRGSSPYFSLDWFIRWVGSRLMKTGKL